MPNSQKPRSKDSSKQQQQQHHRRTGSAGSGSGRPLGSPTATKESISPRNSGGSSQASLKNAPSPSTQPHNASPICHPNSLSVQHNVVAPQAHAAIGGHKDIGKSFLKAGANHNWDHSLTASTGPGQAPPPTPQSKRAQSPIVNNPLDKIMKLPQLIRDGRKTPKHYRDLMWRISTPSQITAEGITEHYNLEPCGQFQTMEDVYRYRGYKKLGKIDEGAFGVVFKAMRSGDWIDVAVKEIDLNKKRTKRVEEMKRELFVLQRVQGKNIVQLIEHFVVQDVLVIVMEFCAGSNLSNYLKEQPLSELEGQNLFTQMASSVKQLHRAGIAHRDIKLNNFLLDASRRVVKVADFGLSSVSWRSPAGLTLAKTYCGTEPYMAPEILRRNKKNQRAYNPMHADVWSLGVCLYAMMTRTFPFKLEYSQRSLYRAQTTRRWRLPRNVRDNCTEDLNDLVWHMLDPDPERRITMVGVTTHPWINMMGPYQWSPEETRATVAMDQSQQSRSPATRL